MTGTRGGSRGGGSRRAAPSVEELLERIGAGESQPLYLVAGDRVLSEPAARRIAGALAERAGCAASEVRRPASLRPALADLRTFSLFDQAKVTLVIESAVLADRAAAAELIDEAAEALPLREGELSARQVEAAGRLLLVLRLFAVEPDGDTAARAEAVLGRLPAWVFQGGSGRGKRARGKKQIEELRSELAVLLQCALAAGLQGWVEGDLAELERVALDGLPDGYSLVLAESAVATEHPLVVRLAERGAFVQAGALGLDRGGEALGLERLIAELRRETGVAIRPDAVAELARRTLRRGAEAGSIDAESSSRLAAEYRKLALVVGGAAITLDHVRETVEDRGDEDVWKLLDEIGSGDAAQALSRLRRLLLHADDTMAARLSVWSLVADFCRQVAVVRTFLDARAVAAGERNYRRFQERLADALRGPLPGGGENPIGNLHPYRLHRVYLAASRLRGAPLDRLPWRLLEAEARLKGESGEPDAALFEIVAALATGRTEPLLERRGARRA